jgi:hypothetical protein
VFGASHPHVRKCDAAGAQPFGESRAPFDPRVRVVVGTVRLLAADSQAQILEIVT